MKFEPTNNGYRCVGNLDEFADFRTLPDQPTVLDMSGVRRINSTGLRNWIRWKAERAHKPTLSEVPTPFVSQLSNVPELRQGLRIVSVRAPYFDPKTQTNHILLLDATMLNSIKTTGVLPTMTDPVSGAALEFEEDENSYFNFLRDGVTLTDG